MFACHVSPATRLDSSMGFYMSLVRKSPLKKVREWALAQAGEVAKQRAAYDRDNAVESAKDIAKAIANTEAEQAKIFATLLARLGSLRTAEARIKFARSTEMRAQFNLYKSAGARLDMLNAQRAALARAEVTATTTSSSIRIAESARGSGAAAASADYADFYTMLAKEAVAAPAASADQAKAQAGVEALHVAADLVVERAQDAVETPAASGDEFDKFIQKLLDAQGVGAAPPAKKKGRQPVRAVPDIASEDDEEAPLVPLAAAGSE
jgi:hypothetical protein